METVWSAWLFAAHLPSASQGMFWSKDLWQLQKLVVGTATKVWLGGPHPAATDCTSLAAPGDGCWCWGGKRAPALKLDRDLGHAALLSVALWLT